MTFEQSVPVNILEQQHRIHRELKEVWEDYEIMHASGTRMKMNANRFLAMRTKEPTDQFNERIKQFTYTPLLSTIAGWYTSKLFRTDPEVDMNIVDDLGIPTDGKLNTEQQKYFNAFMANADRKGTTLLDVTRELFRDMMLYRKALVQIDLPFSDPKQFVNRAEQLDSGALNAYLVVWNPQQLVNWSYDAAGHLEWVILQSYNEESLLLGKTEAVDRWTILTQTEIAIYERRYKLGDHDKPKAATLSVPPRRHVLSAQQRVPLYELQIPDILWIADRIALPMRNHLNLENSYSWALNNQNLAIPYISGARLDEKSLTITELGLLNLPEGADAGYLEQSGSAFTISENRLERLREEIYRAAYLMDQGRSSEATPAAQSGLSKQADKEPADDVLNAFGDIIRAWLQQVLKDVAQVRSWNDIAADVRGFSFETDSPEFVIGLVTSIRALNIPSDSLDKELMKRVARLALPDANSAVVTQIITEIDEAASRQEREDEAARNEQDVLAEGIRKQMAAKPKPAKK